MTILAEEITNATISHTFKFILPVNLFLAGFILLQNTIILVDYFPDRKKFVTSLFMLIAVLDMLLALGSLLKAIPAVICRLNSQANIPKWLNFLHFPISGTSYILSVFVNVVLSVTKTINIKDPFSRINTTAVHIVLFCGASVWTITAVVGFTDALFNSKPFAEDDELCPNLWLKMMEGTSTFIAYGFATIFSVKFDQHDNPVVLRSIVEIFAFILPCVAVFVCMLLQMIYIRRYLSSGGSNESRDSHHVNVTVFLVSMLFVVCTFLHTPDIAFLLAKVSGQGILLFFARSFKISPK